MSVPLEQSELPRLFRTYVDCLLSKISFSINDDLSIAIILPSVLNAPPPGKGGVVAELKRGVRFSGKVVIPLQVRNHGNSYRYNRVSK